MVALSPNVHVVPMGEDDGLECSCSESGKWRGAFVAQKQRTTMLDYDENVERASPSRESVSLPPAGLLTASAYNFLLSRQRWLCSRSRGLSVQ